LLDKSVKHLLTNKITARADEVEAYRRYFGKHIFVPYVSSPSM